MSIDQMHFLLSLFFQQFEVMLFVLATLQSFEKKLK